MGHAAEYYWLTAHIALKPPPCVAYLTLHLSMIKKIDFVDTQTGMLDQADNTMTAISTKLDVNYINPNIFVRETCSELVPIE